MSPSLPLIRGRVSVSVIEKGLGIKWARGLSRHGGRLKIPVIRDLEKEMRQVVEKYSVLSQREVLASSELEDAANRFFDSVGPRMWPTPEEDPDDSRLEYLAVASQDNLEGHYPRDLYYAVEEDRRLLRQSFYNMVVAKCIMYLKNHPGWKSHGAEANEANDGNELDYSLDIDEPGMDEPKKEEASDEESTSMSSHPSSVMPSGDSSMRTTPHSHYQPQLYRGPGQFMPINTTIGNVGSQRSPTSSDGGLNKRKLSTDSPAGTKRSRNDDAVRYPVPQSLIVVLKLTPQKLAGASIPQTLPHRAPEQVASPQLPVDGSSAQTGAPRGPPLPAVESHEPAEISQPRRPSAQTQSPSNVPEPDPHRGSAMAMEVLGDYIGLPVVQSFLHSNSPTHRLQLDTLKRVLNECPSARMNPEILQAEMERMKGRPLMQPNSVQMNFAGCERFRAFPAPTADPSQPSGPARTTDVPAPHHGPFRTFAFVQPDGSTFPGTPEVRHPSHRPTSISVPEQPLHTPGGNTAQTSPRVHGHPVARIAPRTTSNGDVPRAAYNPPSFGFVSINDTFRRPAPHPDEPRNEVRTGGPSKGHTNQNMPGPGNAMTNTPMPLPPNGSPYTSGNAMSNAPIHLPPNGSPYTMRPPLTAGGPPGMPGHSLQPSPQSPTRGHDRRTSLEPDLLAILERAEVEIDWDIKDEYQSFIPMEACYTVERLFSEIDKQKPPSLQCRSVKAAKVEQVNYLGRGKSVRCRILRTSSDGVPAFRAMLRRLKQMGMEADPELKITVEWA
ncbi:hypothetical protein LTR97_011492 [Elasticomyces elasticus]|uniref:DUF7071 domain-containing protein n=1 Tax=Elasticomyces elasticus TaxID=574655 RepID=A0AAN7ZVN9_9PEZI|nr:hypothetical protein LTR97_011492 [Elasticomyces elasticus]